MSQVRAKSIKRKIKNVKARRDVKRSRARKNRLKELEKINPNPTLDADAVIF